MSRKRGLQVLKWIQAVVKGKKKSSDNGYQGDKGDQAVKGKEKNIRKNKAWLNPMTRLEIKK